MSVTISKWFCGYNWHETTSSVWITNSERQVMEKLGHMIPFDACFFDLNVILNHSNIS